MTVERTEADWNALKDAWRQGQLAYPGGFNPYDEETQNELWREWNAGYDEMEGAS